MYVVMGASSLCFRQLTFCLQSAIPEFGKLCPMGPLWALALTFLWRCLLCSRLFDGLSLRCTEEGMSSIAELWLCKTKILYTPGICTWPLSEVEKRFILRSGLIVFLRLFQGGAIMIGQMTGMTPVTGTERTQRTPANTGASSAESELLGGLQTDVDTTSLSAAALAMAKGVPPTGSSVEQGKTGPDKSENMVKKNLENLIDIRV
jgi:hypothetical protein